MWILLLRARDNWQNTGGESVMDGRDRREEEGPRNWREGKTVYKENQSSQSWHVDRRNQAIEMESEDLRFNQSDARWTQL